MSINPDLECAGSTAAPPLLLFQRVGAAAGGGEIGRRVWGGGGCGVSEKPCGVRAVRHVRHSAASGTVSRGRGVWAEGGSRSRRRRSDRRRHEEQKKRSEKESGSRGGREIGKGHERRPCGVRDDRRSVYGRSRAKKKK